MVMTFVNPSRTQTQQARKSPRLLRPIENDRTHCGIVHCQMWLPNGKANEQGPKRPKRPKQPTLVWTHLSKHRTLWDAHHKSHVCWWDPTWWVPFNESRLHLKLVISSDLNLIDSFDDSSLFLFCWSIPQVCCDFPELPGPNRPDDGVGTCRQESQRRPTKQQQKARHRAHGEALKQLERMRVVDLPIN